MKMVTTDHQFLRLLKGKTKEVKFKAKKELEAVLEATLDLLRQLLNSNTLQKENIENEVERIAKLLQIKNVFEQDQIEGFNRKVQIRPIEFEEQEVKGKIKKVCTKAIFILKWGGQLTHAGVEQSTSLGQQFR